MNAHATVAGSRRPRARARPAFPRLPLFGAFALLAFSVVAIIFGQTTGIGTVRVDHGDPVAIRDIVIAKQADETVTVIDANTGEMIRRFAAEEGGFVRGSLPAFNRMREVAGEPVDAPFRLIRWQNGAVSISDTTNGRRIFLNAFGPDHAAQYDSFLSGYGRENE